MKRKFKDIKRKMELREKKKKEKGEEHNNQDSGK